MKKLYAIVSPAYTEVGNSLRDLSSFVINPFHELLYEQVCGYSLGHEVVFFDSEEEAKKNMELGVKGSKGSSRSAVQKAIIELDADDEKITGFCKLHTVEAQKRYEQAESVHFFRAVRIPVWKEEVITPELDVTEGALAKLNSLYQESKNTQKHPSLFETFNEFGI